jgi:hypothetical protein
VNYYIYQKEEKFGPFSREQILEMQRQGLIGPDIPCCKEDDPSWKTVADFFSPYVPAIPQSVTTGTSGAAPRAHTERFLHPHYLLCRKFFSFLGTGFNVFDPEGVVVFFSKQKAFKLREDIRVYSDESREVEVLSIKARDVLDFSATYDVFDPLSNAKVGVLRRKGFSSLVRDTWKILDADDQVIGQIEEKSMSRVLLRRYLFNLVPQHFILKIRDIKAAEFRQHFNPLIYKIEMDFSKDTLGLLDRRLGVAAGILLAAIEGRPE